MAVHALRQGGNEGVTAEPGLSGLWRLSSLVSTCRSLSAPLYEWPMGRRAHPPLGTQVSAPDLTRHLRVKQSGCFDDADPGTGVQCNPT